MNNNFEDSSMSEMMEALKDTKFRINSGDIVKGKVISVTDNEVFVNIGYMSDGIIARNEISVDEETNLKDVINAGDEIYVYIMSVNDGEGNVELSKKKADALKVWDELEETYKSGESIVVKVKEVVKGGLVSDIKGVRAFIPASQASASYIENLNDLIGKELKVKVIEFDKEKNKVVLSRKEVEKLEVEAKKDILWSDLKKGEKRSGVVTRLAKFGAFVDLGGIDGLIHISDLSWKRVLDPSEVVSVGDKVEVYVLNVDKSKGRISLGLKEVQNNPWNEVSSKYKINTVVDGTVVKLADFGAFVELESGIEGLVHISQISEERILKPSSVLNVGDKVKVKVLEINEKDQRLSLSIKEAMAEPQEDFSKYNEVKEENITLGDLLKDKFKNFKFEE